MYSFGENTLTVDGKTFDFSEVDGETILWEPEPQQLHDVIFTVNDYPEKLIIEMHHETGFETYLFHEVHLSKDVNGIKISFYCLQPNKYWEGTGGYRHYCMP